MTTTVLTLLAHPDDAEILCGGALCLLHNRGWKVHIATSTLGDCGSAELPPEAIAAIRQEEAQRAAAILDGEHHSLGLEDLAVFYDRDAVQRATALLRRVRPDVVITHSPSDYMLDHEETSRIARAACFNAPVPNAPVPNDTTDQPLDHVPRLYYVDPIEGVDPLGHEIKPTLTIDVSKVIERKAELLACHASQRDWLRSHHGIDEYIEGMKRWSAARGAACGFDYGEGFRQHLGHAYPRDNILASELESLCKLSD